MNQRNNLRDICRRYSLLYTSAVSDVLDELGLRQQALPYEISPLSDSMKVAGVAFTVQGRAAVTPEESTAEHYMKALHIIDELPPFSVLVNQSGGDTNCAHWGELSSNAVRARGCQGVVVDGGVRDTNYICRIRFPVFARYRTMVDAIGRWVPTITQEPITIGRVVIHPGDFIFGDRDGVLVIPERLIGEVLERAAKVKRLESRVRRDLRSGALAVTTFQKYGKF
jgi:4-hydroxy-4-methyl-2-oxoglutarate aldolase